MRVCLYARVSKDENFKDSRFQDPENQLRVMREFCKVNGFVVVEEFVDRMSGANPARPRFMRMMSARGFDAVVVWKLDRFSRESMSVMLGYINRLKGRGVALISVTEGWLDTRDENPVSELVLAIFAWFCGEERRKISERTRAGIARKREKGSYRGGRPKGAKDKKPRSRKGYFLRKR